MQLGDFIFQAATTTPIEIDNTNYFLVLLTAVLAGITGYYALQTKKSVVALDASTKAQFKPFIKASLSMVGPVALHLMVVNIGKGAAEDVSIKFRVIEAQNTERQWTQELMLPEEHQKFFIPVNESKTEMSTGYFENHQTTVEFEWECKDILGLKHSGKRQIDVTEFVQQMNRTQARYEEPFEEKVSTAITEISKKATEISDTLRDIRRDLYKDELEEDKQP